MHGVQIAHELHAFSNSQTLITNLSYKAGHAWLLHGTCTTTAVLLFHKQHATQADLPPSLRTALVTTTALLPHFNLT